MSESRERDTDAEELIPSVPPSGPRIPTISPIYPPPMSSPDEITQTENARPTIPPGAFKKTTRLPSHPGPEEREVPPNTPDWARMQIEEQREGRREVRAFMADLNAIRGEFQLHRTKANSHLAEHDKRLDTVEEAHRRITERLDVAGIPELP